MHWAQEVFYCERALALKRALPTKSDVFASKMHPIKPIKDPNFRLLNSLYWQSLASRSKPLWHLSASCFFTCLSKLVDVLVRFASFLVARGGPDQGLVEGDGIFRKNVDFERTATAVIKVREIRQHCQADCVTANYDLPFAPTQLYQSSHSSQNFAR